MCKKNPVLEAICLDINKRAGIGTDIVVLRGRIIVDIELTVAVVLYGVGHDLCRRTFVQNINIPDRMVVIVSEFGTGIHYIAHHATESFRATAFAAFLLVCCMKL